MTREIIKNRKFIDTPYVLIHKKNSDMKRFLAFKRSVVMIELSMKISYLNNSFGSKLRS
jgi:hypothetical protein